MPADDRPVLDPCGDRLTRDLERLSEFREERQAGWTRRACSLEYLAARAWLRQRMAESGLRVEVDAAANLIGRLPGRRDDLDPIVIGSHIDTVSGGGRFDGTVGVLAGIEIARCLGENDLTLDHSLEIIDFFAAEPSDWNEWNIGVQAIVGRGLDGATLNRRTDDGISVAEAIRAAGGRPEAIHDAMRRPGSVAAYLELHIEQGSMLDGSGASLGIVTELPESWELRLKIAGWPLVPESRLATMHRQLLEAVAEVEAALQTIWQGNGWTLTIGRPVMNHAVIPPVIEVRVAMSRLGGLALDQWPPRIVTFRKQFQEVMERRSLSGTVESMLALGKPTAVKIQELFAETARDLGVLAQSIPSGAAHAANWMSWIAPVGMLMVPSKGGRTHCPDEWTEPADVARGTRVLGETLLRIDARVARKERLRDYTEWTLLDRDGTELGTLLVVSVDQPWFICNFEPRSAFESIRPLFDEEFRLLHETPKGDDAERWASWEAAYGRIGALGLRVISKSRNEQYTDPFLHIDGRRAQFRGLPDRPDRDEESTND